MRNRSDANGVWGPLAPHRDAQLVRSRRRERGDSLAWEWRSPSRGNPRSSAASDELVSGQLPNDFPFINRDPGQPRPTAPQGSSTWRMHSTSHRARTAGAASPVTYRRPAGASGRVDVGDPVLARRTGRPRSSTCSTPNSPNADVSTKQARYASYSMLRKGLFGAEVRCRPRLTSRSSRSDDPLGAGGSLDELPGVPPPARHRELPHRQERGLA